MRHNLSGMLRRTAPGFYDRLVKIGASPAMHRLRNLPSIPAARRQMRQNHPHLLVDITERMGLGAMLTLAVRVLAHAEERNLRPVLRFSNPLYAPAGSVNSDWLPLLFDRTCPEDGTGFCPDRFVRSYWHIERQMRDPHGEISVAQSHRLLFNYMRVRGSIVDAVDDYCGKNGVGERTLAIHYRGTDKYLESPRVALENVIRIIGHHEQDHETIFVATDEPEFLERMHEAFPSRKLRHLGCKWIFPNAQPAHLMPGNGPEKGREALLTMLVLARCGLCIRTPSNLSHWARVINPGLQTILLQ